MTKLTLTDILPLTCSRSGTCCHAKTVRLNPWELACLAKAMGMTTRAFRDRYCDFGGIQLRFDGAPGWRRQRACSLYVPEFGCSAHAGRPLACRLYPLGRQRQGGEVSYMFHGSDLPCMDGCSEVIELPHMSVATYIDRQDATGFEVAQDEYLELMQGLADHAFAFLLESGLAESGDRLTLRLWRQMGTEEPDQLCKRLGSEWIDLLMLPEFMDDPGDSTIFARRHHELVHLKVQQSFGELDNIADYRNASEVAMGLALHLARGLGANPAELAEHWIKTAKSHGALD